ncbi:MAG TPA: metallophosphoesterase [Phycisphaerae bacterium]|nr:metallophosphoesterase [Phycisphaerae bacterium]
MSFFGTVLTIIATVLHVYVFGRACTVPLLRSRLGGRWILAIGAALWVLFLLGRTMGRGGAGPVAEALELAAMMWLATAMLLAVCLAAVDAITCFGWLLRRRAPALRGWALAAGAVLAGVAVVQGLRPPVVRDCEVALPGLPADLDGTVLVAVSDLHLGSLLDESWLAARVAQIRRLEPDMVVLLGDVLDGHGPPPEPLLAGLDALRPPLGVWAVLGNHDRWAMRDGGSPFASQPHVRLLVNESAEVCPGLVVVGVEDITSARRRGNADGIVERALAERRDRLGGGATILLSHTPLQIEEAAAGGADLTLCGHTHGGQVWPMGYLARLRHPWFVGRYQVGDMTLMVSRGAGTWGPRMRLWHPGEILRITLRRAHQAAGVGRVGPPDPRGTLRLPGLERRRMVSA